MQASLPGLISACPSADKDRIVSYTIEDALFKHDTLHIQYERLTVPRTFRAALGFSSLGGCCAAGDMSVGGDSATTCGWCPFGFTWEVSKVLLEPEAFDKGGDASADTDLSWSCKMKVGEAA